MAIKKKTKTKRASVNKKSKRKPRSHGKDGRKSNGRFSKGNTLSRGNSGGGNKEKAKELKRILIEAVTEKDIKAIVKKMKSQAKAGDALARKELFDRLWGRAIQEVDIGEKTVKSIPEIVAIIGIGNESGDR